MVSIRHAILGTEAAGRRRKFIPAARNRSEPVFCIKTIETGFLAVCGLLAPARRASSITVTPRCQLRRARFVSGGPCHQFVDGVAGRFEALTDQDLVQGDLPQLSPHVIVSRCANRLVAEPLFVARWPDSRVLPPRNFRRGIPLSTYCIMIMIRYYDHNSNRRDDGKTGP
jgi:hypothetical protein